MKKIALLIWVCITCAPATWAQHISLTPFEASKGKQSATVTECFAWYSQLQQAYPSQIFIKQEAEQLFPFVIVKSKQPAPNPLVIFINNAIHPGEPDGVDASMMLVRDICTQKTVLPDNVELHIIPFYNVAGGRRRGPSSRANQNGPEEYGFRANGQNLDLNRDGIKMDAADTWWFRKYFHYNNNTPDIFIDTHVSNGADYQYTMTLLATQHNQLGHIMGTYQHDTLVPAIYALMKQKGHDVCPYVNHFAETPDSGWTEFFDSPRFISGYAALFHSFAILTETHMLKPFDKRVWATYDLLQKMIEFSGKNANAVKLCRQRQIEADNLQTTCAVEWEVDTNSFSYMQFKGYEAGHKPSEISGQPRLYYDRTKPYTKKIKFRDSYKPHHLVDVPEAYLLPVCNTNLIANLKSCGVFNEPGKAILLENDTSLELDTYHIESYKTLSRPYEGHYLHYDTKIIKIKKKMFIPADTYWLIQMKGNRYRKFLANVLEPVAPDSYFNWNFFDGILQQKEGYSDYVFEDIAAAYLRVHPELEKQLNDLKQADAAFAKNGQAQLDWVYKHSPWHENSVNAYPVYRLAK